tara:strand:+ start:225 stop:1001 length:777 start_codon:yes stop_codon:yes gene_type:complete
MNPLLRSVFWGAVKIPAMRKLLSVSAMKINDAMQALSDQEITAIYERYKEFTRIPAQGYAINLSVLGNIPVVNGCVVECGTWRGGMSAGMADLLGAERTYYLFDSFEGLPDAKGIDGESAISWQSDNNVDNCRTEEQYAHDVMELSSAVRVHIMKGWFNSTLSGFEPDAPIAVLRLDADWYSSTAECLNYLYPFVPKGGLILIDDYFAWDGCSRAVHDYLSANSLADRIRTVGSSLAYIVKSDMRAVQSISTEKELVS